MSALPIPGQDTISVLYAAARRLEEACNKETGVYAKVAVEINKGEDARISYIVGAGSSDSAYKFNCEVGPVLEDVTAKLIAQIPTAEKLRADKLAALTAEAAKLGYVIEPAPKEAA